MIFNLQGLEIKTTRILQSDPLLVESEEMGDYIFIPKQVEQSVEYNNSQLFGVVWSNINDNEEPLNVFFMFDNEVSNLINLYPNMTNAEKENALAELSKNFGFGVNEDDTLAIRKAVYQEAPLVVNLDPNNYEYEVEVSEWLDEPTESGAVVRTPTETKSYSGIDYNTYCHLFREFGAENVKVTMINTPEQG